MKSQLHQSLYRIFQTGWNDTFCDRKFKMTVWNLFNRRRKPCVAEERAYQTKNGNRQKAQNPSLTIKTKEKRRDRYKTKAPRYFLFSLDDKNITLTAVIHITINTRDRLRLLLLVRSSETIALAMNPIPGIFTQDHFFNNRQQFRLERIMFARLVYLEQQK